MKIFRRSSTISAPLVAALALTIVTGCRKPPKRCVDEHNHVVDDSFCQNQPNPSQPSQNTGNAFYPQPVYRYYYGGSGGWSIGSSAVGGTYSPTPGQSYSSGTTRGGFGGASDGGSGSASGGSASS
jgi:hypothetical protein